MSAFEQNTREGSESPLSSANVSFSSPGTPGPLIKSPDIKPIIGFPSKGTWPSNDPSPPKEDMDIDVTIERMDVDETLVVPKTHEASQSQVLEAIGRVLLVSWTEKTDSSIYLPDILKPDNYEDYEDLVSQSIMEVLQRFAAGANPLQGLRLTTSDSDSGMDSPEEISSLPSLPSTSGEKFQMEKRVTDPALAYLMSSYSRVAAENRRNPKVIGILFLF